MKQLIIAAAIIATIFCAATSHARDPYGRSYSNSSSYGRTHSSGGQRQHDYSSPAPQRNYSHGGEIYMQNGYQRNDGNYVMPHYKTRPDNNKWNNLGEWAD